MNVVKKLAEWLSPSSSFKRLSIAQQSLLVDCFRKAKDNRTFTFDSRFYLGNHSLIWDLKGTGYIQQILVCDDTKTLFVFTDYGWRQLSSAVESGEYDHLPLTA